MKTLESMTKDERSLLVYLETRLVDHDGLVDSTHMNAANWETASKWNAEGFIKFGRVKFSSIKGFQTHWCEFSEEAWQLAHAQRKVLAPRLVSKDTLNRVDRTQP